MNFDLFSPETQAAIKNSGRPAAGWFCSYTPLELIDAAGFTPVRISGAHGATGAADSIMHTNICPYIKSCLQASEDGLLDFVSAFVFTNGCDAQRRLYDTMKSRKPAAPSFLIAIPKLTGPEQVRRLAAEFAGFKSWLEELSGKIMSDAAIRASMDLYSELRENLRRFDSARLSSPPKLSGSRAMEVTLAAQHIPAADAIKMISEESESPEGTISAGGPVVLLAGNMLDDPEIVRRIEKYGARVAADDLCTGRRLWDAPPPDTGLHPVDALAKMYLTKSPCPRMACHDDPLDRLKEIVDNLNPDGVIFHILKFCDTHLYNIPRMREMLRSLGVKALFIESDYTPGAGQMDTRIQAFIEIL